MTVGIKRNCELSSQLLREMKIDKTTTENVRLDEEGRKEKINNNNK